jgi:hypothetical protein
MEGACSSATLNSSLTSLGPSPYKNKSVTMGTEADPASETLFFSCNYRVDKYHGIVFLNVILSKTYII